ncbi:MAG: TonB-dependent receptor, partial [Sphingobacteriaceae bacterium]
DNVAAYESENNGQWEVDLNKTNHFLYKENIHAVYGMYEKKIGKLSGQAGLRYEYTSYRADQLGNVQRADTAFSRKYGQFFPNGYLSYQADSSNSFTLTVGRRIDRPAYQVLNPFIFIINKYTYQTGNPYILPQYSWNFELSHQYKELLTTTISYSNISNYFSQLFLNGDSEEILLYTQGNVGHTYIFGLAEAVSASPLKWWSVTGQALYNYKKLSGFNGNNYTTDAHQLNLNINNQFTIGSYTAELSGFYTTRSRNDVQERLYPTGQLSVGVSRPVLKKKGTIKFSARDVLYTNVMEGLTQFPSATEYFKFRHDTRVVSLSFTYRFGKQYKAVQRSQGSAADERDRVGGGS